MFDNDHNDPIVLQSGQVLDPDTFNTEFDIISISTTVNDILFKYVTIVSILQIDGSIGFGQVSSQNILIDNVIVNKDCGNLFFFFFRNQTNDIVMMVDNDFGSGS